LDAAHRRVHGLGIGDVTDDRVGNIGRRDAVEPAHLVPAPRELPANGSADGAGRTGDEHLHAVTSLAASSGCRTSSSPWVVILDSAPSSIQQTRAELASIFGSCVEQITVTPSLRFSSVKS